MDKPRCHNCKSFSERKYVKSDTDTFGRWCDGFCSKDKQYTWFLILARSMNGRMVNMRFYFIRDKEASIGVEIESTGRTGGDGSCHKIKITNPCSLNFLLSDYQEEQDPHYPRLKSLEMEMSGDWEVLETINALKYIVKCLEEVRDSDYGF